METNLKNLIKHYNKLYREGNPAITDQQYDDLLDEYKSTVSIDEYNSFRESLFEEKGKIKHPYVMGSLSKLKAEDQTSIKDWINKSGLQNNQFLVMAKIDGMSCRLHYHNKKFVSATTRGDGEFGEDVTDKVKSIIPATINLPFADIDIRGELVITKENFDKIKQIDPSFKNPRNTAVGIINRKDDNSFLQYISFYAYEIMGNNITYRYQQLLDLISVFSTDNVVKFISNVGYSSFENNDFALEAYSKLTAECPYEIDGLVICPMEYVSENKRIPDRMIAFKTNSMAETTMLVDIDWGMPSKDGRMVPVADVEPIELGGATISRVTCYNALWIKTSNLKYGSIIKILKSGDIIPKIVEFIGEVPGAKPIDFPESCPICGSKLEWKGVDLVCDNPNCLGKTSKHAEQFIKKLGVKNVSLKTLQKIGLTSIRDVIEFKPENKWNKNITPSIVKFYEDLSNILRHSSIKKLLSCCNFPGISDKIFDKIWENIPDELIKALQLANAQTYSGVIGDIRALLPYENIKGIGEASLGTFCKFLLPNYELIMGVKNMPGYSPLEDSVNLISSTGESICFTGNLESMSRNIASEKAKEIGLTVVNGVNKNTTYLVMANPNSMTSKAKKAREFGTKILSEEDFLNMIKGNRLDESITLEDL